MEYNFKNQHTDKTQAVPYTVDVFLDSGHKFSGIGSVEKFRTEFLNMVKERQPHFGADGGAEIIARKFLYV